MLPNTLFFQRIFNFHSLLFIDGGISQNQAKKGHKVGQGYATRQPIFSKQFMIKFPSFPSLDGGASQNPASDDNDDGGFEEHLRNGPRRSGESVLSSSTESQRARSAVEALSNPISGMDEQQSGTPAVPSPQQQSTGSQQSAEQREGNSEEEEERMFMCL